jgi:hypothetical protein
MPFQTNFFPFFGKNIRFPDKKLSKLFGGSSKIFTGNPNLLEHFGILNTFTTVL